MTPSSPAGQAWRNSSARCTCSFTAPYRGLTGQVQEDRPGPRSGKIGAVSQRTRPAAPDPAAIRGVLRAVDPQLRPRRAYPLTGGVSAQVTAIEAELPDGGLQLFVLRQYGAADVAGRSDVATAEYRLLAALHAVGLPVPRPYYASDSGAWLPGPFLVIEFIEGEAVTEPPAPPGVAGQFAAALAELHQAGIARADTAHLPDIRDVCSRRLGTGPGEPDEALSEAAIRAVLAPAWPPPQLNEHRVLHGDFWLGNTLWRDGRLVAVIDWEDAAFGDPLADLANARLELAMLSGAQPVTEFTRQYRARMPGLDLTALPYWDLMAALRPAGKMAGWGIPVDRLAAMQAAHRRFVTGALAQLDGG
jgi:aminoglycoside phosphotransferase (APT) family kinase protein